MSLGKTADGAKRFLSTIREWIGEGLHPAPNAQDRADICTGRISGKKCPYNYQGAWSMPDAVAGTIRLWAEAKTHLRLTVEGEDKLGHCEVCNCVLSLKVHVPIQTILNHTPADQKAKFPAFCWISEETKQPTA